MAGMKASLKTRWWWPYLAAQAIGLFHFFHPLPFHYRHTIGKWAALPVFPGISIGWTLDLCIRSGSVTRIYPQLVYGLADYCFIVIVAELINCGAFALTVWLANWYRERRIVPEISE